MSLLHDEGPEPAVAAVHDPDDFGIVGLRTASYEEIRKNCITYFENGFMMSVYSENENKDIEFKEL